MSNISTQSKAFVGCFRESHGLPKDLHEEKHPPKPWKNPVTFPLRHWMFEELSLFVPFSCLGNCPPHIFLKEEKDDLFKRLGAVLTDGKSPHDYYLILALIEKRRNWNGLSWKRWLIESRR
uniref:Uncharacterized protein n=1 Tax=Compsopogon caeruleus TaxID=31354 RepID=A0A7S1TIX7_9RHOD